MSILNHVWGESSAADRVCAQVSGLMPSKIAGRLFCMVFQAFLDESFDDDSIVVGGYIDTAENWMKFSKEWAELLPGLPLDWNRRQVFKMSELAKSVHGKEFLFPAFYRVIEKYCRLAVSVSLMSVDIERAKKRIFVPHDEFDLRRVVMDGLDNRYVLANISLMQLIRNRRQLIKHLIPEQEVIDYYFDDRSDKEKVKTAWRSFMASITEDERRTYGVEPRFEREEDFAPLQAADAWAWWVRDACVKSLKKGGAAVEIDFNATIKAKDDGPQKLHFLANEDFVAKIYQQQTRLSIHPSIPVLDLKTGFVM